MRMDLYHASSAVADDMMLRTGLLWSMQTSKQKSHIVMLQVLSQRSKLYEPFSSLSIADAPNIPIDNNMKYTLITGASSGLLGVGTSANTKRSSTVDTWREGSRLDELKI